MLARGPRSRHRGGLPAEIERLVVHYYPTRLLASPIENDAIVWDWDVDHCTLTDVLAAFGAIDRSVRPGPRSPYDISEEVIVGDAVHVQLCHLGPFAAVNYGIDAGLDAYARHVRLLVESALRDHNVAILDDDTLELPVSWILPRTASRRPTTVYDCLFFHPTAARDDV